MDSATADAGARELEALLSVLELYAEGLSSEQVGLVIKFRAELATLPTTPTQ